MLMYTIEKPDEIRKENLLARIDSIEKRATYSLNRGMVYHFPSVEDIIGKPPALSTDNTSSMINSLDEIISYYSVASYIEGRFVKILKSIATDKVTGNTNA